MKKLSLSVLTLSVLTTSLSTVSASDLSGGLPATVEQLEQAVKTLSDAIAAIPAPKTVDASTVAFTGSKKVFAVTGFGPCNLGIYTYDRTNNTVLTRKFRQGSETGGLCQHDEYTRVTDSDGTRTTQTRKFDTSGNLVVTNSFDENVINLPATMTVGGSWATGSDVTVLFNYPGATPDKQTLVDKGTLIQKDVSLSVNGTSYTGCIKIHSDRRSNTIGYYNRVNWRCPGVGLVKRVQHGGVSTPSYRTWTLISTTP